MDTSAFLKAVREARNKKGFSQDYVAGKLNISQPVYSRLEKGAVPLRLDQAQILSQLLGVSLDFNTSLGEQPLSAPSGNLHVLPEASLPAKSWWTPVRVIIAVCLFGMSLSTDCLPKYREAAVDPWPSFKLTIALLLTTGFFVWAFWGLDWAKRRREKRGKE